mgnify:CR=1 FL=1|jgi:hypothetical protein
MRDFVRNNLIRIETSRNDVKTILCNYELIDFRHNESIM